MLVIGARPRKHQRLILECDDQVSQFSPNATAATASVAVNADNSWRLLTNNCRHTGPDAIDTTRDPTIVTALLQTRAIIGEPN